MLEDGRWVIFIFKEQVFVPTTARTKAGFYMGIEPVEIVDARDHAAAEHALMQAISRGNPSIPTPVRATFPKNPLLKYANVKSDSSFDRQTKSWQLSKRDGAYFIVPYRLRRDRGKVEDTERGEAMPTDLPLLTVVRRLVGRALGSR
jgi:hypothetical protein